MIHKANKGVLYIDEIGTMTMKTQQELLSAMQEKKYAITGQSENSSGAMVRSQAVPCDFVLVASGNLQVLEGMHIAMRSRIRGYGYEVFMKDSMEDTPENRKKLVSILVPAYNEEETLNMLYERLEKLMNENSKYDFEILLVNDGSKDNTFSIMKSLREKDKRICYLNLSRNYGKETAMIAGLDYVKGDCVILIDADLQDPPELIPEMLKFWEDGYDDVYAKRKSRKGETWLKKFTSKMYYRTLQSVTKIEIQKDTGDFRLLDRRCVEALKSLRESERYTKGLYSWIGYKKKEILYDRDPRIAGKTKYNYGKLINLSLDGITSFTTSPLRWSAIIGVIVSLIAFIYMLVIIFKTIICGVDVPGYASTMVVILFLGGIQLISLGIIGEYLGRAFYESKGRPLYFIDCYNEERETNLKKKD